MSVVIVNGGEPWFKGSWSEGELGEKILHAQHQVEDRQVLCFLFSGLWSDSNVQIRESSLKESFAICDFQCNLGVSSHTEEPYWLAVLTEAASWSSLHLVSKGQEQGTVKERGWNKVRHWQSSLSIWRESQNCPSTEICHTHTRKPDLTSLTHTHAFLCLLSTLSSLYFCPSSLLFVSPFLPPSPSSKQGQPRLSEFWMPLTSFVHSINSFKLPPCLVFQPSPFLALPSFSSLVQCCLLIITEVNIISWSHGQTVDKDSVWLGYSDMPILICFWAITNVHLHVFFFSLCPNIEKDSRWSQPIFSLQAQCLTALLMN